MSSVAGAHTRESNSSTPSVRDRGSFYFIGGLGTLYVVGMHLTLPNVGGLGLVLPFNAFVWLFFALPLGIGLYQVAARGQVLVHRESAWLALAALLLSIPVLYPHAYPLDAITRLGGLWAGWVFFVLLQQFAVTSNHRLWLMGLIAAGVLLQVLFGYAQYLVLSPGNWFRYAAADFRPVGVFQQPNVMASFLVTGLAISAYWAVQFAGQAKSLTRWRKMASRLVVFAMPVLTLPLIVLLSSRTGWLAGLLVVLVILPYVWDKQHRAPVAGWLVAVTLGVLLGIGLAHFGGQSEQVTGRMAAKATTADPARQDMYRQSWDLFVDAPFAGHGFGRFESAFVSFGAEQRLLDPDYPATLPNTSHPHNEILFWVVEGGVVALLGLVVIAGVALRLLWQQPSGQRLTGVALLLPIVLHSQLEHPFYVSAVHWLTLLILLAGLAPTGEPQRRIALPNSARKLARMASLVLPAATVVFMATVLHTNNVLNEFQRQEYRELDDLNRVSNGFVWRDRIDWLYYYSGLYIGVTTDTPEYIQPYIDWSDDILARKPRPQLMQNLIIAHEQLGQEQEALEVLEQVRLWFPGWGGVNLRQDMKLDTEVKPEI